MEKKTIGMALVAACATGVILGVSGLLPDPPKAKGFDPAMVNTQTKIESLRRGGYEQFNGLESFRKGLEDCLRRDGEFKTENPGDFVFMGRCIGGKDEKHAPEPMPGAHQL
ncbi:MAG: hypothetical protein ABSE71_04440 [Candidatus Micrarchaeaceae archaeon]|jgi:hypothetical protein|nr:hypothetical protein [Candidatus Micrarchaeota archaeon]HII09916.1 hypothetical protein [Candidatus Micrarchaeota archaeon]